MYCFLRVVYYVCYQDTDSKLGKDDGRADKALLDFELGSLLGSKLGNELGLEEI